VIQSSKARTDTIVSCISLVKSDLGWLNPKSMAHRE